MRIQFIHMFMSLDPFGSGECVTLGRALWDDHHDRFRTKKKKVINGGEVLDSLSDLDEVSRFPHSREWDTGILCAFLNSIKDGAGEMAVEMSSSRSMSGIRRTSCKRKNYPVTRTM
ncbi:hypothetical protein ACH5RR_001146 [Cinchona calisaya]|uniref:Uncharacterized protein n=1 Tax=Cinchona calisaya TaxID=153742 RepID=A0ABD3B2L0_9GENT